MQLFEECEIILNEDGSEIGAEISCTLVALVADCAEIMDDVDLPVIYVHPADYAEILETFDGETINIRISVEWLTMNGYC